MKGYRKAMCIASTFAIPTFLYWAMLWPSIHWINVYNVDRNGFGTVNIQHECIIRSYLVVLGVAVVVFLSHFLLLGKASPEAWNRWRRENISTLDLMDRFLYGFSALFAVVAGYYFHLLVADKLPDGVFDERDWWRLLFPSVSLFLASLSVIRSVNHTRRQARILGFNAYKRIAWGMYKRARKSCYSIVHGWYCDQDTLSTLDELVKQKKLHAHFAGPIEAKGSFLMLILRMHRLKELEERLHLYHFFNDLARFVVIDDSEVLISSSTLGEDDISGNYYVEPELAANYTRMFKYHATDSQRNGKAHSLRVLKEIFHDDRQLSIGSLTSKIAFLTDIHLAATDDQANLKEIPVSVGGRNLKAWDIYSSVLWFVQSFLAGAVFKEGHTKYELVFQPPHTVQLIVTNESPRR